MHRVQHEHSPCRNALEHAPALRILWISQLIVMVLLAGLTLGYSATNGLVTLLRTPDGGIQPQAMVEASGVVHLINFKGDPKAGDIFYVRREIGQAQFSEPIQVNRHPRTAMALGTIRGAQMTVGRNGRVHVVWDGMGEGIAAMPENSQGRHPLFYTRLDDSGSKFEPERNVITHAYGLDGGSSVAADQQGNVYVAWHAPRPGSTNGEAGRAVFIARSTDEGQAFERERPALSKPTGACGCCGLRAFAASGGDVYILFRAANETGNRDEVLIRSRDRGQEFAIAYSHAWKVATCPMSSAFISESQTGVLAAAETHGRVFLVRTDPITGNASSPVSPDRNAKHPVVVANHRGETLLVWSEGTGWGKGGSVAWQVYDEKWNPTAENGKADGLAAWSLPTAFVKPDGGFVIVY